VASRGCGAELAAYIVDLDCDVPEDSRNLLRARRYLRMGRVRNGAFVGREVVRPGWRPPERRERSFRLSATTQYSSFALDPQSIARTDTGILTMISTRELTRAGWGMLCGVPIAVTIFEKRRSIVSSRLLVNPLPAPLALSADSGCFLPHETCGFSLFLNIREACSLR